MKAPGSTVGATHPIIKTLFHDIFPPTFSTQILVKDG